MNRRKAATRVVIVWSLFWGVWTWFWWRNVHEFLKTSGEYANLRDWSMSGAMMRGANHSENLANLGLLCLLLPIAVAIVGGFAFRIHRGLNHSNRLIADLKQPIRKQCD